MENYAATNKKRKGNPAWLPLLVIAIILCGLSFYGGIAYEKDHQKSQITDTANNGFGQFGGGNGQFPGGGRFNGQAPNIGTVTAVSSDSITINDSFSNSSKTFSISSSTTASNNGQSALVSDIKTGDRVLIRTDSSNSSQASQININPSFGGPMGGSVNTN